MSVKLVVADDHEVVRTGLATLLAGSDIKMKMIKQQLKDELVEAEHRYRWLLAAVADYHYHVRIESGRVGAERVSVDDMPRASGGGDYRESDRRKGRPGRARVPEKRAGPRQRARLPCAEGL